MSKYIHNERGQTIIILLLVMVVGLTIGLSLVSRSLTDIKISQQTELSQRAFSAAEAGLEYALSKGLANISTGISKTNIADNVSYSGQVEKVGSVGYELSGKAAVEKDDVAQVNLDSTDLEGGTMATLLDVYWGERGTSQVPSPNPCDNPYVASLELTFVTQSGTTYGIQKYAYNACSIANNFDSATAPLPTATPYFAKKTSLAIPSNAKILRIKPLYNNASIKIVPKGSSDDARLPQQAYKLTVKGEAQGKVRAIEWQQPIKPAMPAIFDYVLFSGSSTTPLQK